MDVETAEGRFEEVKDAFSEQERRQLQEQRERYQQDPAADRGHYGHDIQGALVRGHSRKANEAARELLKQTGLMIGYGERREDSYRSEFSISLEQMIEAAAENGVSAEEIRKTLEMRLQANRHANIEASVQKGREKAR